METRFITPRAACCALASALALAFLSPNSYGVIQVYADATGNLGVSDAAATASGGSVSQTQTGSNPNAPGGSIVGRVSASFGVLRIYGESHINMNPGGVNYGGGTAYFTDEFTFNDPNHVGEAGTFTFTLRADGVLTSSNRTGQTSGTTYSYNPSKATLSLSVHDGTTFTNYLNVSETLDDNGSRGGTAFLGQPVSVTVPFTFGTTFSLRISLSGSATTYAEFGADSYADGEHTLEWGGITSVKDNTNTVMTGYTLGSGSGVNYVNAAPEPSGVLLLLFGSVAVLAWKGRDLRRKA
jgi:hypothetical protein